MFVCVNVIRTDRARERERERARERGREKAAEQRARDAYFFLVMQEKKVIVAKCWKVRVRFNKSELTQVIEAWATKFQPHPPHSVRPLISDVDNEQLHLALIVFVF